MPAASHARVRTAEEPVCRELARGQPFSCKPARLGRGVRKNAAAIDPYRPKAWMTVSSNGRCRAGRCSRARASVPRSCCSATRSGPAARIRLTERLAASIGGNVTQLDVWRPEDFLRLHFHFVNLAIDTSVPNQPVLRRKSLNKAALVVVEFPPQHVAEEVLLTSGAQQPNPPNPPPPDLIVGGVPPANVGLQARLAGGSRLAFARSEQRADDPVHDGGPARLGRCSRRISCRSRRTSRTCSSRRSCASPKPTRPRSKRRGGCVLSPSSKRRGRTRPNR